MGLSLSTKTPGSPDNSFAWLLHNSGIALSSGFPVSLGDGTETALYLKSGVVGITAAGGRHEISSAATSTRPCRLADASGVIYPAETFKTTANVNNSTTTPSSGVATELNYVPESGSYEFELIAWMQSAATTTGVRVDITGPVQVTSVSWDSNGPAANASTKLTGTGMALPAQFLGVAVPAASSTYAVNIAGKFLVTGGAASPIQVQIYSEVASSQVTLLSGSIIRYWKL